MDDLFTEIFITKKRTAASYVMQILMILFTVSLFLAGVTIHPLFIAAGLFMIWFDQWVFKRFRVEWEYSYVNGELDVAKIYNKEARKQMGTYVVRDAELFARADSSAMQPFSSLPVKDYTEGTKEARANAYALVYRNRGRDYVVLFCPDDKMIKDIRIRMAGRAVL